MSINPVNVRTITGVSKNNNDYKFKELKAKKDGKEEKIDASKKYQLEYFQSIRQNPHTAFFHDPRTTHRQKIDRLNKDGLIYNGEKLSKEIGVTCTSWTNDRCLESEVHRYLNDRKKRVYAKVYDMSHPINMPIIETMREVSDRIITNSDFREKLGMNEYDFRRYCNAGLLERFQLPDKKTGEMVRLGIIDPTTPTNQAGIQRYEAITPKKGEIFNRVNDENNLIWKENKTPIYLNSKELSELGFGSPRHTIELVEKGYYKGAVKTARNTKGQTVKLAYIDVNDMRTRLRLEKERDRFSPTTEDIADAYNIDIFKIEDAIIAGEIDIIKEKVFNTDTNYARINLTNPKNAAGIDKLLFEKRIEEELIKEQKLIKRSMQGLRAKLSWHFSPKTRNAAGYAYDMNERIKSIEREEQELIDTFENPNTEYSKKEEIKERLKEVQAQKDLELRRIFKYMWTIAGVDEYKQAHQKAKEIIELINTKGIEAIDDEEILQICFEYLPSLAQ